MAMPREVESTSRRVLCTLACKCGVAELVGITVPQLATERMAGKGALTSVPVTAPADDGSSV
ncbi:hypothetical protein C0Q70_20285 [Pomacea canaliculata]|uniref:Uncharacterized protein n=1 Tax=Pomacea canaliculata TaxID=400727 RepID=A0A2T7NF45_POMCA|nr:hypothetical protein C0Q70_20285 [Pomacea canaliculata]